MQYILSIPTKSPRNIQGAICEFIELKRKSYASREWMSKTLREKSIDAARQHLLNELLDDLERITFKIVKPTK